MTDDNVLDSMLFEDRDKEEIESFSMFVLMTLMFCMHAQKGLNPMEGDSHNFKSSAGKMMEEKRRLKKKNEGISLEMIS